MELLEVLKFMEGAIIIIGVIITFGSVAVGVVLARAKARNNGK